MIRGQLLSLDFLLSLILATLAIGLMIQFLEVNTYAQKQEETIQELSIIGETAGDLIVSNNSNICFVGMLPKNTQDFDPANDANSLANNCLSLCKFEGYANCDALINGIGGDPTTEAFFSTNPEFAKKIFKKRLGLTEEFGCNINVSPAPKTGWELQHECTDIIPTEKENIYSTTRKVVFGYFDGYSVWNKKDYLNCTRNTEQCNAELATITLTVWRK